MGRVRGGVRLAQPVLSVPVYQGDPQRDPRRGGRPEQVGRGESPARAPADHCHDGHLAAERL
jgi:hypothetical protein